MSRAILMVCIIFLSSCGGVSDVQEDLGEGYKYIGNGVVQRMVCVTASDGKSDSIIIHPKVIDYRNSKRFILVKQALDKDAYADFIASGLEYTVRAFKYTDSLVDSNVAGLYVDQVKKHEEAAMFYRMLGRQTTLDNTIEDQHFFRATADSLLNHDPQYRGIFDKGLQYWIINKPQHEVYGPLDSSSFARMKEALEIPEELD